MKFEIVVAHDSKRGIGLNNAIPWENPEDMTFFRTLTKGDSISKPIVIMGSRTFCSLKETPLRDRLNIVISSGMEQRDDCMVVRSVKECITRVMKMSSVETAFVIGGSSIYNQFLDSGVVTKIHSNLINGDYGCDRFFDEIPSRFTHDFSHAGKTVVFNTYSYTNTEEVSYLNLVKNIIKNGEHRDDRTGTGTFSLFGTSLRFSLKDYRVPVLTTKKVFWSGVVKELLWFISGSTDGSVLSKQGVRIWDKNGSREFLDNLGFKDREVGDLGPIYPFSWRHYGAKYIDCKTDYSGKGVDQLQRCINMIKTDPWSRRIIMTSWNPVDLDIMNLPPCHMTLQLYVSRSMSGEKELSGQVYQRSVDTALGLPFNISSYSLLIHMIAQCCDMKAKELVHVMGDTHMYSDHVSPISEQISRVPFEFPSVHMNSSIRNIDDFSLEDIVLDGYYCHPSVKMDMSA